ncbi:MAG: XdhC/CoxI family protein [Candidatus Syntrophosphaera sp.]|jgi:xanthine dehydrogenase accessory factor|nr:XdhC/CoxI family protein [Candidatus Syntrophosphaera sp.]
MSTTKDYYAILYDFISKNQTLWQVTIISSEGSTPAKPGMKMLIPLTGKVFGNLGGGELEHLLISRVREEQPSSPILETYLLYDDGEKPERTEGIQLSMVCGGKVSLFIEPLFSSNILYIIGAGHCGKALAHLAGLCDFQTRLIDNRPEALQNIPPEICSDLHLSDYTDLEKHIQFNQNALIVIMTQGHIYDEQVLEQCLGKPFRYLGMIGSKRKAAKTFQMLKDKNYSDKDIQNIHCPVGLAIGSKKPYEIAISILAEIILELSKDKV